MSIDGKYWDWRERQKKIEQDRQDDVLYMKGYYDAYSDGFKRSIDPSYECGWIDGEMDLHQDLRDSLDTSVVRDKRASAWAELESLEKTSYGR